MKLFAALTAAALAAAPGSAEPRQEIEAANSRWTRAVIAKDVAALEAILGPEFELTGGAATGEDGLPRALWLANLQKMQISDYQADIADLHVAGDFAVATVRGRWTVALGGPPRTDAFELRDIWVRRAGGWQVIRRYRVK